MPSFQEKHLEWEKHLSLQKASGLSITCWCHENGIAPRKFYYWRKQMNPNLKTEQSFKELTDRTGNGITIEYRGFRIQVNLDFHPATLKHCLSLLKELPC